jgi:hypothetical protein
MVTMDKKTDVDQTIDNKKDYQENDTESVPSRREALKKIAIGGTIAFGGAALPPRWTKPIVDKVLVPAHAQTSPPPRTTASPVPSPGTTQSPAPTPPPPQPTPGPAPTPPPPQPTPGPAPTPPPATTAVPVEFTLACSGNKRCGSSAAIGDIIIVRATVTPPPGPGERVTFEVIRDGVIERTEQVALNAAGGTPALRPGTQVAGEVISRFTYMGESCECVYEVYAS